MNLQQIPEKYRRNIEEVATILKKEGCTDVFLFGSLANGKIRDDSDIDIGIKGLPAEKFIPVYSKLYGAFDTRVDLVDFDYEHGMFDILQELDEVIKIG